MGTKYEKLATNYSLNLNRRSLLAQTTDFCIPKGKIFDTSFDNADFLVFLSC